MSDYAGGGGSVPDWRDYLEGLQEVLENTLLSIKQSKRAGVRSDIICLEAFDELNQYLDGIKQELGIL